MKPLVHYPDVEIAVVDTDAKLTCAANVDPNPNYPEARIWFSLSEPCDADGDRIEFAMTSEQATRHIANVQRAIMDVRAAIAADRKPLFSSYEDARAALESCFGPLELVDETVNGDVQMRRYRAGAGVWFAIATIDGKGSACGVWSGP